MKNLELNEQELGMIKENLQDYLGNSDLIDKTTQKILKNIIKKIIEANAS